MVRLILSICVLVILSGCVAAPLAVGGAMMAAPAVVSANNRPSEITDQYTDAQIERCQRNLTFRDQQRIQERAQQRAFIPLVGPALVQRTILEEAEKICKEKGLL